MHFPVARLLVAASLCFSALGCSSNASEGAASGQAQPTPKQAVAAAALLLDVRSAEEFATGHLDRAENIPVDEVEGKLAEIASKVGGDKSKPVVVYCASGGRAGRAKTTLEKAGFSNVTNAGGYKDLR
jgi:phage shock protein E